LYVDTDNNFNFTIKSDTISSEQKPEKGVKEKCHQVNSTSSQKVACTEGESGTQTYITDITMVSEVTGNIALRTILLYFKNGSRRLKVNA